MKNFYLFLIFLAITTLSHSQNTSLRNTLTGEFGLNKHGSGDITGFTYGVRYNKVLNKTFDLIFSFEGNLNDREDTPFLWEDPNNGNIYNSTPHDVNAGFQINVGKGFNIINSRKHKFGINPSIFGRYSANSLFDVIVTDYPALTDFPVPIRYYYREDSGNQLTAGASFRLFYNYRISDKYFIGLNPGFQLDLYGNTILFTTLSFGLGL